MSGCELTESQKPCCAQLLRSSSVKLKQVSGYSYTCLNVCLLKSIVQDQAPSPHQPTPLKILRERGVDGFNINNAGTAFNISFIRDWAEHGN